MRRFGRIGGMLALAAVLVVTGPLLARATSGWQSHVSPRLMHEMERQKTAKTRAVGAQPANPRRARMDAAGRTQIDISHPCDQPVDSAELEAAGFHESASVEVAPFCVIEGWAASDAIPAIAALGTVSVVDLPDYGHVIHQTLSDHVAVTKTVSTRGSAVIDGNGVGIMNAGTYVSQTGTNGAGVTVGVISDDISHISAIKSRGELPSSIANYTITANPNPTDEGTVMLEEVHAVAPGATLAFCGPQTTVEYVKCLQKLIGGHATIVADDLGFPTRNLMGTDSFGQAVASVLQTNPSVMLFSAVGNNQTGYWQGSYQPSALVYQQTGQAFTLTCSANGQVDNYFTDFGTYNGSDVYLQSLSLGSDSSQVFLQWADPYTGNKSNFDLYLIDQSTQQITCAPGAGNANPYAVLDTMPPGNYWLLIGTPDTSLAGKFLKLDLFANGASTLTLPTDGGEDSQQYFIDGVQTIGAVNGGDGVGSTIESFSQGGPLQLEYPTPAAIQAPVFVAPDNVYVDISGTTFPSSSFTGTSAATPNAAAVAALIKGSFTGIATSDLLGYLRAGAAPLGGPAPDPTFGYGRVDAMGTLNAIPAPTISTIGDVSVTAGQSSGNVPFTVTGVGKLTFSGSSDNSSALSVSGGAVSVSCDASNNCNLVIKPAASASGTAHLTVYVSDGAQRSAQTQLTVTVAASTTAGGSSGGGGGGAADLASLLVLGFLPWRFRRRA